MANNATTTQPSYYYLLIAQTCFQRSARTADQVRSHALYELGRNYLSKAKPEGSAHIGRQDS